MSKPVPVILDTDIGTDIDDSWALVMLLNSPELDLRLITTATFNTEQRTAVTAKCLRLQNAPTSRLAPVSGCPTIQSSSVLG